MIRIVSCRHSAQGAERSLVGPQRQHPRAMPCHRDGVLELRGELSISDVHRRKALLRAGQSNAELSVVNLERDCALPHAEREWLESTLDKLGASALAYHHILRVARTVADLAGGTECVEQPHLAEALHYRRF